MLLGCHLSIAKGFTGALDAAEDLGTNVLQIFSHNASSWQTRPIAPADAAAFQERRDRSAVEFLVAHTSYLLNLASPEDDLFERSVAALTKEVERAGVLGIEGIVTHLGAHKGAGERKGIERIAAGLERVIAGETFASCPDVMLLLENTAGSGTTMGRSFSEIGSILTLLGGGPRLGVCLDTCHAFAAGYDVRTKQGLAATLSAFDRAVGLDRLKMVHLNDSKFPLGSRRDRHEHVGRGEIGEKGICLLVNEKALRDLPFVLETPKTIDGQPDADSLNLAAVRSLRSKEGFE